MTCAQSCCDAHARDCQNFENMQEEFVHAHLNKPYMKIVDRVFLSLLNIGGEVEKLEAGTMSEVVRPRGRSHILLFSAVGYAIALFLLIVVLAQFPSVRGASPQEEKGNKRITSNTSLNRCEGIESVPNMNKRHCTVSY